MPQPGTKNVALEKAARLVRDGALDAALKQYRELFARDPADWGIANTLGDLYARVGRTDDAVSHFVTLAEQLAADGYTAKARAVYRKVLRMQPGHPHAAVRVVELESRHLESGSQMQRVLDAAREANESASRREAGAAGQEDSRPDAQSPAPALPAIALRPPVPDLAPPPRDGCEVSPSDGLRTPAMAAAAAAVGLPEPLADRWPSSPEAALPPEPEPPPAPTVAESTFEELLDRLDPDDAVGTGHLEEELSALDPAPAEASAAEDDFVDQAGADLEEPAIEFESAVEEASQAEPDVEEPDAFGVDVEEPGEYETDGVEDTSEFGVDVEEPGEFDTDVEQLAVEFEPQDDSEPAELDEAAFERADPMSLHAEHEADSELAELLRSLEEQTRAARPARGAPPPDPAGEERPAGAFADRPFVEPHEEDEEPLGEIEEDPEEQVEQPDDDGVETEEPIADLDEPVGESEQPCADIAESGADDDQSVGDVGEPVAEVETAVEAIEEIVEAEASAHLSEEPIPDLDELVATLEKSLAAPPDALEEPLPGPGEEPPDEPSESLDLAPEIAFAFRAEDVFVTDEAERAIDDDGAAAAAAPFTLPDLILPGGEGPTAAAGAAASDGAISSEAFEEIRITALEEAAAALRDGFVRADSLIAAGEVSRAVGLLEEMMCALPWRQAAGARLARVYRESGDCGRALEYLEWAAERAPIDEGSGHELAYELAVTLEAMGQRDHALGIYRELLSEVGPGFRDVAARAHHLAAA